MEVTALVHAPRRFRMVCSRCKVHRTLDTHVCPDVVRAKNFAPALEALKKVLEGEPFCLGEDPEVQSLWEEASDRVRRKFNSIWLIRVFGNLDSADRDAAETVLRHAGLDEMVEALFFAA